MPDSDSKIVCLLCLGKKTETIDHFFECPALASEVEDLNVSTQRILREAKFPFSSLELSWKTDLVRSWVSSASNMVSEAVMSGLERIAWDFLVANEQKQFIGVRHFIEHLSIALKEQKQQKGFEIPDSLLSLLVSYFNLGMEGNTNVLSRCVAFSEWCSNSPNDVWFGAQLSSGQANWRGFNTYLI